MWSDGGAWRRGHWLNGRAGLANLSEVVSDLCARAGVTDVDASQLAGAVSGFIADGPSPMRAALEPLMAAFAFDAREHDRKIVFTHRGDHEPLVLSLGQFTADSVLAPQTRGDPAETPIEARISFIDPARDYAVATISARRLDRAEGGLRPSQRRCAWKLITPKRLRAVCLRSAAPKPRRCKPVLASRIWRLSGRCHCARRRSPGGVADHAHQRSGSPTL